MPCDSLFIDFLGVNHCISFDTVRVVLDSSFTPQVLRDSQAFYSWAFMAIVAIIGLGSGILAFVLNKLWDKKVDIAVDKLKQDFAQVADEKAMNAAGMAAKKVKDELEKTIIEQRQNTSAIKKESLNLWKEHILDLYIAAHREKNPLDSLQKLCSLMMKLSSRFEQDLVGLIIDNLLPELERRLNELGMADNFDKFLEAVRQNLMMVKASLVNNDCDKNSKSIAIKGIDKIDKIISIKIDEYYHVKNGEVSGNRNRLQVRENRL